MECANVGVILICPERKYAGVRIDNGFGNAQRIFPGPAHDWAFTLQGVRAIELRVRHDREPFLSLEELTKFAATRGNDILVTKPRLLVTGDVEANLAALYDELVRSREEAAVCMDGGPQP